jgi:hypothetical protein
VSKRVLSREGPPFVALRPYSAGDDDGCGALFGRVERGVLGEHPRQVLLQPVFHQVPAHREAIGYDTHELPLGADVLEEHDELELEEDDRVHRRPAAVRVERPHQLPDERKVEPGLQATVEVVLRDEVLKREVVG